MATQEELDTEVQLAQAALDGAALVLKEARELLHKAQDACYEAESRYDVARRLRDHAVAEAKIGPFEEDFGAVPEDPVKEGSENDEDGIPVSA